MSDQLVIDAHFTKKGREVRMSHWTVLFSPALQGRLVTAVWDTPATRGFGVDENTALVCQVSNHLYSYHWAVLYCAGGEVRGGGLGRGVGCGRQQGGRAAGMAATATIMIFISHDFLSHDSSWRAQSRAGAGTPRDS